MKRKPNSKDRLKKTIVSCYLEPKQHAALRALSERTRVPAQVYVREALDDLLAKYRGVK